MAQLPFLSSTRHLETFAILLFFCLIGICMQNAAASNIGEKCTKNMECTDTEYCDKSKICACKTIPDKLFMKYNAQKKVCESLVGSVCSIGDEKGWLCVDDAVCNPQPDKYPSLLGVCECKPGHFVKDGICGNEEKTSRDIKSQPNSPQVSVFWASGAGCVGKNLGQSVFYSGVILFLLSSFIGLPQ